MDCRWSDRGAILINLTPSLRHSSQSFIVSSDLDYKRLVGQGYDGAAVFSRIRSGVQVRMQTHSAHAVHIHCVCHRLQLASIQAAKSNYRALVCQPIVENNAH